MLGPACLQCIGYGLSWRGYLSGLETPPSSYTHRTTLLVAMAVSGSACLRKLDADSILPVYAASAMAGNSVVRSTLGGTLPLAGPASMDFPFLSFRSSVPSSKAQDIIPIRNTLISQLTHGYVVVLKSEARDKTDMSTVQCTRNSIPIGLALYWALSR